MFVLKKTHDALIVNHDALSGNFNALVTAYSDLAVAATKVGEDLDLAEARIAELEAAMKEITEQTTAFPNATVTRMLRIAQGAIGIDNS